MPRRKTYKVQWLGFKKPNGKWSAGMIRSVQAYGVESAKKAFAELMMNQYGYDIRGEGGTIRVAEHLSGHMHGPWVTKVYS